MQGAQSSQLPVQQGGTRRPVRPLNLPGANTTPAPFIGIGCYLYYLHGVATECVTIHDVYI